MTDAGLRLSPGMYFAKKEGGDEITIVVREDYIKPSIQIWRKDVSQNVILYHIVDRDNGDENDNGVYITIKFLDEDNNLISQAKKSEPEFYMPKTIVIPDEVLLYGVDKAKIMI